MRHSGSVLSFALVSAAGMRPRAIESMAQSPS